MRNAVILLAAALSACAPMQWVKPDATPEQFASDDQECRQAAWREASSRYWFYQPMGPVFIRNAGGGAMMVPGGSVVDPYAYQMLEENRLAQFCMESRGYRLEPTSKK